MKRIGACREVRSYFFAAKEYSRMIQIAYYFDH